MSDMPPEFYVPAFGALTLTIGALVGAIKYLYTGKETLQIKFQEMAVEGTKTITLNTEALRGSTDAIKSLAATQTPLVPPRGTRGG